MSDRSPHILNAASNLLGVCFVLITGLKLTRSTSASLGDEMTWLAAVMLLFSLLLAYFAVRHHRAHELYGLWADRIFIGGTLMLFSAVAVIAFALY